MFLIAHTRRRRHCRETCFVFYCHSEFFCSLFHKLVLIFCCRLSPYMSNKKSTQTYTISQEIAAPNLAVSVCMCSSSLHLYISLRLSPCLSLYNAKVFAGYNTYTVSVLGRSRTRERYLFLLLLSLSFSVAGLYL